MGKSIPLRWLRSSRGATQDVRISGTRWRIRRTGVCNGRFFLTMINKVRMNLVTVVLSKKPGKTEGEK